MKLSDNFRKTKPDAFRDMLVRSAIIHSDTGRRRTLAGLGQPGSGKTAVCHQAHTQLAEHFGLTPVDTENPTEEEYGKVVLHIGNIGEEVIAGLPWADKETGRITRAFEDLWPKRGRGILILDEAFQKSWAQPYIAQLVYEGRIGQYVLPEGWFVVILGNTSADRAGAQRILTHMQDRIHMFIIEPDIAAAQANFEVPCNPEVGLYLRWFPEHANTFDPRRDGPYATLRGWDAVNTDLHDGFTLKDDFELFQGRIGAESATNFRVFVTAVENLPNIEDMLANPDNWKSHMQSAKSTTVAAFASVMLRRYEDDRDINSMGTAIKLIQWHRAEFVAALTSLANEIDKRVGDGVSVYDAAEYVQFSATYSHLVA